MKNTAVDGKIIKEFALILVCGYFWTTKTEPKPLARKQTSRTVFDDVASSFTAANIRYIVRIFASFSSPFLIFSKCGTRCYCDLLPCIFTSDVCSQNEHKYRCDVDEIDVLAVEEMKCGKKIRKTKTKSKENIEKL